MTVLHPRKDRNTPAQGWLSGASDPHTISGMAKQPRTFKDLIEAAARPYKELWRGDKLNLGALARRYKAKGHPLSEASLSRILRGLQEVGPDTVEATHHALGIPKALLRGEPMSPDAEEALANYRLSTILLAQRLESLPKEDYHAIVEQVERALEHKRRLDEAIRTGNVTPIERAKR
jgi:hypothetical protein